MREREHSLSAHVHSTCKCYHLTKLAYRYKQLNWPIYDAASETWPTKLHSHRCPRDEEYHCESEANSNVNRYHSSARFISDNPRKEVIVCATHRRLGTSSCRSQSSQSSHHPLRTSASRLSARMSLCHHSSDAYRSMSSRCVPCLRIQSMVQQRWSRSAPEVPSR